MKGWNSSRESPPCLNEKVTNICFALNLKCPLIEGHNFFRLILHCSFVEPVFMMNILGLLGVWLWYMPYCDISTGYYLVRILSSVNSTDCRLVSGWALDQAVVPVLCQETGATKIQKFQKYKNTLHVCILHIAYIYIHMQRQHTCSQAAIPNGDSPWPSSACHLPTQLFRLSVPQPTTRPCSATSNKAGLILSPHFSKVKTPAVGHGDGADLKTAKQGCLAIPDLHNICSKNEGGGRGWIQGCLELFWKLMRDGFPESFNNVVWFKSG